MDTTWRRSSVRTWCAGRHEGTHRGPRSPHCFEERLIRFERDVENFRLKARIPAAQCAEGLHARARSSNGRFCVSGLQEKRPQKKWLKEKRPQKKRLKEKRLKEKLLKEKLLKESRIVETELEKLLVKLHLGSFSEPS